MKRYISILAGFIFCLTSGLNLAYAAPGSLDPTFGQGGKVLGNFGSPILVAAGALQTDGKILVVISINQSNFAVVRYLPNGSLDTSFGTSGFAQTSFTNFNIPSSVALQADGKIVVAGTATSNEMQYELALARFNIDGSLDNSFGTGGQATTNLPGLLTHAVALIQPDGRILVAASALVISRRPPQLAMARYNANGSLDISFGQNGTLEQVSAANAPTALAVDSAFNMLIGSGSSIVQFSPSGTAASQVAPAAITSTSFGGPATFQSDGKYVVAKLVLEGSGRLRDLDTQVVRFTSNGAIDSTFNSPIFDFSGEGGSSHGDITSAIAIQPNGQIVLGASHFDSGFTNELFALARLNPNGSLDSTFGNGGVTTTSVGGGESVNVLLLQPDGKYIAIGTANNFSNVALVRFLGQ